MSFGTENATPVGGQSLAGFIVSKAFQSRKDAKKQDRKEKRKKKKDKEDTQQKTESKQGLRSKLLGSFASLPNLFGGKKPEAPAEQTKQARTSGGATGLAKILTNGFGSLTADTLGLSSALASITQLLNNSFKAQSFTATGVQTISAILSDQLENQSSILSTVKTLRPGGGGGGGKSMFGTSKATAASGDTLTGYLLSKMGIGEMIGRSVGKGLEAVKDVGKKLFGKKAPEAATKAGTKVATEGAEAAARKKLAQEIAQKGLKSKGAIIGGKYISMTAAEAAQTIAPKAAAGPLAKFGSMLSGAKGAVGGALGAVKEKVGGKITEKLGGKLGGKAGGAIARAIPGIQTVLGLGFAAKEIMDGDMVGAGLALGSAIPGPIGWGFLAADIGREVAGPEATDKMFGQALGGNLGLSDQQIQKREKTMSATERAWTSPSTPFFLGSSGGITSLSLGGVNAMVGEAAGGGGGEVVKDLRSAAGRKMMSSGGSTSEDPGMKTSGATTLAVVDQFIKGMGPLGAPVAQALGPDIQNLSRTFGMSQTLPNLRIGGGKFKEDGSAKKTRDKFLEQLISGSLEELGAKNKDKEQTPQQTTPQTTQEQLTQSNPDNPETGSVSQRQQNMQGASNGTGKPLDGQYQDRSGADHGRTSVNKPNLRSTVDTQRTQDFTHKGDGQRYRMLLNYSTGDFEVFKVGAGPMGTNQPIDLSNPKKGGLNEALLQRAQNEAQYLYSVHAPDRGATVRYLSPDRAREIKARNAEYRNNKGARGGDMLTPTVPRTPRATASQAPIGATNIQNSTQSSVSIINIMGGGGSSASIPVASGSSQDSTDYINTPWPSGLAGVLCCSPWSIV